MADAGEQDRDAIDVIARRLIRLAWLQSRLAAAGSAQDLTTRQEYPHLDDDQWDKVMIRADRICGQIDPSEDRFLAAYEHLTGGLP